MIPKITGGNQCAVPESPVAMKGAIILPILAIIDAVPMAMFLITVGKSSPP